MPPSSPRAIAHRRAVALAQHGLVELQQVQLGAQSPLVPAHIPQLLGQAVGVLLDAEQVPGWGCGQPGRRRSQRQPRSPHLLLQEGWGAGGRSGWALGGVPYHSPKAQELTTLEESQKQPKESG